MGRPSERLLIPVQNPKTRAHRPPWLWVRAPRCHPPPHTPNPHYPRGPHTQQHRTRHRKEVLQKYSSSVRRGSGPSSFQLISSTLAGPTFGGIPLTHRAIAESVVVCTGVGRGGRGVQMPEYERGRMLVILMGGGVAGR